MSAQTGIFIAFEGGEGSGKTTQITRLAAHLETLGHAVLATREPGATGIGGKIREILLDPANTDLHPRAEALLYAADRTHHVHTVVRPALRRGQVVLTDRYIESSVVYQGVARGLGEDAVRHLSMWGTEDLLPDLTVLLDIDPEPGVRRALKRGPATRFENEELAFHRSVRAGFLARAEQMGDRYAVVDASQDVDTVAAAVAAAVDAALARLAAQVVEYPRSA